MDARLLRFVQGHEISIALHIASEPDAVVCEILSIVEPTRIVKVSHGSEAHFANQTLAHRPIPVALPNIDKQISRDRSPVLTLFECL